MDAKKECDKMALLEQRWRTERLIYSCTVIKSRVDGRSMPLDLRPKAVHLFFYIKSPFSFA